MRRILYQIKLCCYYVVTTTTTTTVVSIRFMCMCMCMCRCRCEWERKKVCVYLCRSPSLWGKKGTNTTDLSSYNRISSSPNKHRSWTNNWHDSFVSFRSHSCLSLTSYVVPNYLLTTNLHTFLRRFTPFETCIMITSMMIDHSTSQFMWGTFNTNVMLTASVMKSTIMMILPATCVWWSRRTKNIRRSHR